MGILNVIKKAKETDIDDFRNVYVYAKIGDKILIKEEISKIEEKEFRELVDELSYQYPCKINKVNSDKQFYMASMTKV